MNRLDVSLPTAKLLLRLTERLLVEQIVYVETTFPGKSVLGAVQV